MGLNIVRIKGEHVNLCLRRTDEEAIKLYMKWASDEKVNQFTAWSGKVVTYSEIKEWAEKSDRSCLGFNIVTDEGLVGNCDIEILPYGRTGEIGIFIGEESARDKGLGTKVVEMLVKFAFNELGLHMLYLYVCDDNIRAIQCYEKVGFKLRGTLYEADFYGGRWHDWHIMEIMEEDYLKRNKNVEI